MTKETETAILRRLDDMELPGPSEEPDLALVIAQWMYNGGGTLLVRTVDGEITVTLNQKPAKRW